MPQVSTARSRPRQTDGAAASLWRRLTQVAFVLSLALVVCRLLMPETIRNPQDPLAGLSTAQQAHAPESALAASAPASRDPGPATGLVLDLLSCLPALLVLARRAFDQNYKLLTAGSIFPMALLAILAALSPLWAADQFASVVSAAHFACALVFLWSAFQLVRSWYHLRLIAGICVGLLLALSLVGYNFRLVEAPDLRERWNKEKELFLSQQNLKAGTFSANMFENRVLQSQPMGYRVSPNTYAGLLVMLGMVSAGVILQRWADRDHWGWIIVPLIAAAAVPPLIRWTGCRAAYATPVMGALILLAVWLLGRWLARFSRAAYGTGLAGVSAAAAYVIYHGMTHGTLWHDSLNFRWRYWVGSFKLLTDGFYHASRQYFHFIFGVGWENFGPYYLGQRLAIAPEEIRDPHNFIVRAFTELGLLGGILMLAWMIRLWWDLTRPFIPADSSPADSSPTAGPKPTRTHPAKPQSAATSPWLALGGIASAAIAINIAAAIDFSSDVWYVVMEVATRGLFFCMLLIGLMVAALRAAAPDPTREKTAGRSLEIHIQPDRRPAPWLIYAMLAGLATFLIHNLIEFSLFEPASMFLFALLTGGVLSLRAEGRRQAAASQARPQSANPLAARIGLALGALGWLVAAGFLVAPVLIAESLAQAAQTEALAFVKSHQNSALIQAASDMTDAAHTVPFNADYAERAAELVSAELPAAVPGADPQRVKQLLDAAVAANPTSVAAFRARAQFELLRLHDFDAGLADYRRAVTLDPRNVRMRLAFAGALTDVAKWAHRPNLAKVAALEFERAFDDNNQLPPEEVKRLTEKETSDANKDKAEAEKVAQGRE